jgi:putrescine importer
VWLLAHLDSRAIELGLAWLVLGILYLAWLTRLFRRPPPSLDFSEDDPEAEARPAGMV